MSVNSRLIAIRSCLKGKYSIDSKFQSLAVGGKKLLTGTFL